jgi:hypothetical protein
MNTPVTPETSAIQNQAHDDAASPESSFFRTAPDLKRYQRRATTCFGI